ncbi:MULTISPECIES: DUF6013 family protein [Burkholderia]|uniref:DUF6013 family protein n=1 Tax=Burkholderia TaxID=32008 RepID=UPI00136D4005|nr:MULTISPECIES: DUF6013 family protein [Burkholderia]NBI48918.1 hypothetical protein [Burkholderia sp. ISTR5]
MSLRIPCVAVCAVAFAAALASSAANAAPPIKGSASGGNDGQLQYTVKVDSKRFGASEETRKIRSGETDDFNWKSVPPSGAVAMPDGCPDADSLPRDANGAMVRQTQVRLAPSVDAKDMATVQISFQASAPDGTTSVSADGKTLQCPKPVTVSEVKRVSLSTRGGAKTIAMSDGTRVTVSIQP